MKLYYKKRAYLFGLEFIATQAFQLPIDTSLLFSCLKMGRFW